MWLMLLKPWSALLCLRHFTGICPRHAVVYAGDATVATAAVSTPELTDPVDRAEDAVLPASPCTSPTTMSGRQGSSVAPACKIASCAPVALQPSAMFGLEEMPPVAGIPTICHT